MKEPALSQKARFLLLLIEAALICGASWYLFGTFGPPEGEKGLWFYTALLGLVLGTRLHAPFFASPADVVIFAAPAAIELGFANAWAKWDEGIRVAYCIALVFCIAVAMIGATAILAKDTKWQRTSNVARVFAEFLGDPRVLYSVIIFFALYAFHRDSPKEFGIILGSWVLTSVLSPFEGSIKIWRRLKRIFSRNIIYDNDGEVIAYQSPSLILVRQSASCDIELGNTIAVHDTLGEIRLALTLDYVGRDEGILLRSIELTDCKPSSELRDRLSLLPENSVVSIKDLEKEISEDYLVKLKKALIGLVAQDTSIEKLYFEVVKNEDLEEGRLAEVRIGKRLVTYQIVNGLTKEEIVQQKNTHGFIRAQAQKIGEWDAEKKKFRLVKWLPSPNSPVFLKSTGDFIANRDSIGHFPGTDYPVSIKSIDDLVTHNTAILGILGIGKTMLALELVERMLAAGVKVICIDLTKQYASNLSAYLDLPNETTKMDVLKELGKVGKLNVKQNVEEGGSKLQFADAVSTDIKLFMDSNNEQKLKIFNPAEFEVWRQDSKQYQGTASMASLTPAEITQIITEATLNASSGLGETDRARACLVYEEAHSLVPEWSSAVGEGDRHATNGSARAILHGRKFGLGCLLITQRTANVTKTILNQCNTIFAMRTFDDTGKEFLSNYIGNDYASSLPLLSERHAVFFGKASSCENPILIRLNDRDKFLEVFRAEHPTQTPQEII